MSFEYLNVIDLINVFNYYEENIARKETEICGHFMTKVYPFAANEEWQSQMFNKSMYMSISSMFSLKYSEQYINTISHTIEWYLERCRHILSTYGEKYLQTHLFLTLKHTTAFFNPPDAVKLLMAHNPPTLVFNDATKNNILTVHNPQFSSIRNSVDTILSLDKRAEHFNLVMEAGQKSLHTLSETLKFLRVEEERFRKFYENLKVAQRINPKTFAQYGDIIAHIKSYIDSLTFYHAIEESLKGVKSVSAYVKELNEKSKEEFLKEANLSQNKEKADENKKEKPHMGGDDFEDSDVVIEDGLVTVPKGLNYLVADHVDEKTYVRNDVCSAFESAFLNKKREDIVVVGRDGSGKSFLPYMFLKKQVDQGENNKELFETHFFLFDVNTLFAGAKWYGSTEKRVKKVTDFLLTQENPVVFMGDVEQYNINDKIVSRNIQQFFQAVRNTEVKLVFETNNLREASLLLKGKLKSKHYISIDMPEASDEDLQEIIKSHAKNVAETQGISTSTKDIKEMISTANSYVANRECPLGILLRAFYATVSQVNKSGGNKVDATLWTVNLSKLLGVPILNQRYLNTNEGKWFIEKLKTLPDAIKSKVYGQDAAIDSIVGRLKSAYIIGNTKEKPIASFMLAGPTGVGKTEVVKQLAEQLNVPMIRFDMSEFQQDHSIARLIGIPGGYADSEQGGELTNAITANPTAIILIDEFEKASPSVAKIFLQVLDYGRLSDARGVKVNCCNNIIVFTTNLGASELMSSGTTGFTQSTNAIFEMSDASFKSPILQSLPPEFVNRIDELIYFKPLKKETLLYVVSKSTDGINKQLAKNNSKVELSDKAKEKVLHDAYDPKMGARPIEKHVEKHIGGRIAEEMLARNIFNNTIIRVDVKDNEFVFEFAREKQKQVTDGVEA